MDRVGARERVRRHPPGTQAGIVGDDPRMAPACQNERPVRASGVHVKRLLTIGHSYVVAMNRRLAHEMARQGGSRWSVTAAAPATYRGDLGPIELERQDDEACEVVP